MFVFFFSSRRRHTRLQGDWSSDVCSSDLNTLMNVRHNLSALGALWGPFLGLRKTALRFGQCLFIRPKEAWIRDVFARTQRRKAPQPNIDANRTGRHWQWRRLALDREASIPLAAGHTPQRERLDGALDGAMEHEAYHADLRDT